MKKVFIDEYLSPSLRQRMNELVDLNLDLESILSLLSNDLYGCDDYMVSEIKRYLKYLLWLKDNHKERSMAYEKYKKQTKQNRRKTEILPSHFRVKDSSTNLENEFLLAQIRKERKRIDEVSNFHYQKELMMDEAVSLKTLSDANDIDTVDEILETLTDEEIQATLEEMLADETNQDGPNDIEEPKNEKTALDDPTPDQNPKSLTMKTEKISDLTFDDILNDETTTTNLETNNSTQTLFDFDYLEDNGTQTLNDSLILDDEENLELQDFVTNQQATITLELETEEIAIEVSPTEKALKFLDDLEEKYGEQTALDLKTEDDKTSVSDTLKNDNHQD